MQAWGSCSVFIVCRVLLQSVSRVSHSKPGGGRCRRGDPAVYLLFVVFCYRVYLGYHTVSQVVAGAGVGILQCIYCLSCFVTECI